MAFCLEILILGKKGFTIHGQSRGGVLSGYVFVEVSTKYYLGSMHQWGWLKFHLFDSQGAKQIGIGAYLDQNLESLDLISLVAGFPDPTR